MSKKVVLVAGTPAEHSIEYKYDDEKRDFASRSYNYAIELLKSNKDIIGINDYQIETIDFPVSRKMYTLETRQIKQILDRSPTSIGFSVYCWNRDIFLNTAKIIKQKNKDIIILMGGPSVSYNPEHILKENKDIDIIVIGEGEETFSRLLINDFRNLNNIKGIAYRSGEEIVNNGRGDFIDINRLTSPYLSDSFRPKSDALLIEPSRGCLYRCKFCAWSKGRSINIKNKETLMKELIWAYNNGYRKVNLSDTSINMNNEQLQMITDAILESKTSEKLSFSVFMKYEKIDRNQIKLLERVRFDEIIMGIESINPDVLIECGKRPFDKKAFEQIVNLLGSLGNRITLSIITGLPKDSLLGIKRTIEYLESLINNYPDYINFLCSFWLAILPGTRFERDASKYGFEYLKIGTPYITSSKYMSKSDLIKTAEYVYSKTKAKNKIFCEEFYLEVLEKGL